MSPRWVGVCLMAASVVVGVAAGWAMANPQWSIAAALALTGATIGMGVGALWLRRTSWADKTWPAVGPAQSDAVRIQRSMRVVGVFLLAFLPVVVALLVWAIAAGDVQWGRIIVMGLAVLVYSAAGVMFLRRGFRKSPGVAARPSHTRRPDSPADTAEAEEGWRPLGPPSAGIHLDALGSAPLLPMVFVLILPLQILIRIDDLSTVLIWLGVLFAAVAVFILTLRRRTPRVLVNERDARIRTGQREASWSDLVSAELLASSALPGSERTLVVVLRDGDRLRAPITVRKREALALTDGETDLATRIVDASAIELPRAKEDPQGRFSRQLYPSHLTKVQTRELLQNPPGAADALPAEVVPA